MKIFYVGLEPYEGRYTLQLQDWNTREFERLSIDYHVVEGELPTHNNKDIVVGEVLDAHGRALFSMSQISNLVSMLQQGKITNRDVIFFEDMFTPGIESLAYIFDQTPVEYRPKVVVRCLAQTIDPDDFVHRTGMFPWMRHYELMLDNFVDGIICASEEMVAHLRIAGFKSAAFVSGLPFGKQEVFNRTTSPVKNLVGANKLDLVSKPRVIFAARWASEKQPDFYMDVAETMMQQNPDLEFCIAQGGPLRSDNVSFIKRARQLVENYPDQFFIFENLNKDQYYKLLAESVVIFNCALQDWVSNTISEGDTLGTVPIYPAYRSFPETCLNMEHYLYIPWSVDSAISKIQDVLDNSGTYQETEGQISAYQDKTIARTVEILEYISINQPSACKYYRGTLAEQKVYGTGYRSYVSRTKDKIKYSPRVSVEVKDTSSTHPEK